MLRYLAILKNCRLFPRALVSFIGRYGMQMVAYGRPHVEHGRAELAVRGRARGGAELRGVNALTLAFLAPHLKQWTTYINIHVKY